MINKSQSDRAGAGPTLAKWVRVAASALVIAHVMHDLKFEEAFEICAAPIPLLHFSSPCCQRSFEAFRSNIEAMRGQLFFPGFALECGRSIQKLQNRILPNAAWALAPTLKAIKEHWPDMGHMAWGISSSLDGRGSDVSIKIARLLSGQIMALAADGGDEPMACAEGILKNTITLTWTAFEVLCGDIWHNSAAASGSAYFRNPTKKEWNKNALGLKSRTKIRDTYAFSFTVDYASIGAALDGEHIDALAVIRNALVHAAGFSDPTFMKDSNGNSLLATIRSKGANQRIEIDGGLTNALVSTVIAKGLALISGVDQWLLTHP